MFNVQYSMYGLCGSAKEVVVSALQGIHDDHFKSRKEAREHFEALRLSTPPISRYKVTIVVEELDHK